MIGNACPHCGSSRDPEELQRQVKCALCGERGDKHKIAAARARMKREGGDWARDMAREKAARAVRLRESAGFGLSRPGDRDTLNACAGMGLFIEEMLRLGAREEARWKPK